MSERYSQFLRFSNFSQEPSPSAFHSQPSQHGKQLPAMRNRHRIQRVTKRRAAFTTHLVAVAVFREHPAQLSVVTPKSNFQHVRQRVRHSLPQRHLFRYRHNHVPSQTHLAFHATPINPVTVPTTYRDPGHCEEKRQRARTRVIDCRDVSVCYDCLCKGLHQRFAMCKN